MIPDFRYVCDTVSIIDANFEEKRMINLSSKMNSRPHCI